MRTFPLNFQAASLYLCVTTPFDERSTTRRIKSWTFLRQQNSPTLPSHVTSSFPTFFPQVLFQPFEDTAVAVAYSLTLDSFFFLTHNHETNIHDWFSCKKHYYHYSLKNKKSKTTNLWSTGREKEGWISCGDIGSDRFQIICNASSDTRFHSINRRKWYKKWHL